MTTSNAGDCATVDVSVVLTGPADLERVRRDLVDAIRRPDASAVVTVRPVDGLSRDPATGKVRRFVSR